MERNSGHVSGRFLTACAPDFRCVIRDPDNLPCSAARPVLLPSLRRNDGLIQHVSGEPTRSAIPANLPVYLLFSCVNPRICRYAAAKFKGKGRSSFPLLSGGNVLKKQPGAVNKGWPCSEKSGSDRDFAMQEKTKIVLVEDHTILRHGLRSLLTASGTMEVVGEAGDGVNAIRCVAETQPDLVLLDLNMPKMDGISVLLEIKKRYPKTKMVALTMFDDEEYVLNAFKAGADGYCHKSSSHEELMLALKVVLGGKRYISPEISERVLEGYLESNRTIKETSSWGSLTHREKEVLKLVAEGYQNKEIADYLCISVKTVEKHRANIMGKLDLHTASALTAYAIEKRLVRK